MDEDVRSGGIPKDSKVQTHQASLRRRCRGNRTLEAAYNAIMLVDSAVYADGQRTTSTTLEETYRISSEPGKFAWVILHQPTQEDFVYAAREFALRELEVEDAIRAHQRPKLEHYADCLFMVLKSAHHVD